MSILIITYFQLSYVLIFFNYLKLLNMKKNINFNIFKYISILNMKFIVFSLNVFILHLFLVYQICHKELA